MTTTTTTTTTTRITTTTYASCTVYAAAFYNQLQNPTRELTGLSLIRAWMKLCRDWISLRWLLENDFARDIHIREDDDDDDGDDDD